MAPRLRLRPLILSAAGVMAAVAALTATSASGAGPAVRITVLSNRADLVSGGDALVRVVLPKGAKVAGLRITAGGRDITARFASFGDGQYVGLADGLPVGRTTVEARLRDGRGARLVVTNHPSGGPVFAGPQVTPWTCTTLENGLGEPLDAQCNVSPKVSYLYQPTGADPGKYQAYDPSNPPSDVATTKTDEGKTVPYIIRVESGAQDRSIYKLMVLADPSKPWTAVSPQQAWNRKLYLGFGGGCGTMHIQNPPGGGSTGFPFGPAGYAFGNPAADGQIEQPEVLSRGWMTASTGLMALNYNCNTVVSAEAVMMLKEYVVDHFGPVRRTVSVGGSGGSIQQFSIAANYPGLLDGIVTTQSFPDLPAMTEDTADCNLTHRFFTTTAPHVVPDLDQQLAITGKSGQLSCGEFMAMFGDWYDPQNRGATHAALGIRFGCILPPTQTYRPIVNPSGARCSLPDYQKAIWGTAGPGGYAPLTFDNVGVQYGLNALKRKVITPAQFVDLNAKIGGINNEGEFTSTRSTMSVGTATTMHRAGQTTDARLLADVAILDLRESLDDSNPEVMSDMHQPVYTQITRARLRKAVGSDANLVSWYPLPENRDIAGVLAVDRWLAAVDADHRPISRAEKIRRDRPKDVVNTCWIAGSPVTDAALCARQFPGALNGGDARIAAGEDLTNDTRKCQLKPLSRADYPVTFSDAEWQSLRAVFPSGVCDWSRPPVGGDRSLPWMSFAGGPGGRPLGAAPVSAAFGR